MQHTERESAWTYIAAEEGSETSRKRDYALCDPIRKADYLWRRHCNQVDLKSKGTATEGAQIAYCS